MRVENDVDDRVVLASTSRAGNPTLPLPAMVATVPPTVISRMRRVDQVVDDDLFLLPSNQGLADVIMEKRADKASPPSP
jgi:hypothetical protein